MRVSKGILLTIFGRARNQLFQLKTLQKIQIILLIKLIASLLLRKNKNKKEINKILRK
jgi:hypothetical protein